MRRASSAAYERSWINALARSLLQLFDLPTGARRTARGELRSLSCSWAPEGPTWSVGPDRVAPVVPRSSTLVTDPHDDSSPPQAPLSAHSSRARAGHHDRRGG